MLTTHDQCPSSPCLRSAEWMSDMTSLCNGMPFMVGGGWQPSGLGRRPSHFPLSDCAHMHCGELSHLRDLSSDGDGLSSQIPRTCTHIDVRIPHVCASAVLHRAQVGCTLLADCKVGCGSCCLLGWTHAVLWRAHSHPRWSNQSARARPGMPLAQDTHWCLGGLRAGGQLTTHQFQKRKVVF